MHAGFGDDRTFGRHWIGVFLLCGIGFRGAHCFGRFVADVLIFVDHNFLDDRSHQNLACRGLALAVEITQIGDEISKLVKSVPRLCIG